jgi:uncharacterized membrane protein HdeD (DUF308 family)
VQVTHPSRYWPWVLLRALPAAVAAVVVTFNADHSAFLGSLVFGGFAVVSGVVLVLGGLRALRPDPTATMFVVQGAVSVLVGGIALVAPRGGVGLLLLLVGAWAALTGFAELYSGLRSRARLDSAKDWIFAGGLTVLFAIVAFVIPADYSQPFTGPDGVDRSLTASIVLVGLVGAYAAILGVYLVIAGLSLKWAGRAVAAPAAESSN